MQRVILGQAQSLRRETVITASENARGDQRAGKRSATG
jgi:hypothetical protein